MRRLRRIDVLSRAEELSVRERRVVVASLGGLLVLLALACLSAFAGLGGHGVARWLRVWSDSVAGTLAVVLVGLRARRIAVMRGPWSVLAVGIALYTLGDLVWSAQGRAGDHAVPLASDLLWLGFYPTAYLGIVAFARTERPGRPDAGVFLDGIIAGTGLTAIAALLFFHRFSAIAHGDSLKVLADLASPICDLLLVALIVGALCLRGWRLNRVWVAVGASFVVLAIADCLYAFHMTPGGEARPTPATNTVYLLAVCLFAGAAWQKKPRKLTEIPRLGASVLLIPSAFTLACAGLLVDDHFRRLDPVAFSFAVLCLTAALARTALAFRDIESLARAHRQAYTDGLTALPNRAAFTRRIASGIARAAESGGRVTVLTLDLDHFKELNDTLGHTAGDVLLRLVGPRLRGALRAESSVVARLGGDEFAVVLDPAPDERGVTRVAERIVAALSEPFEVEGIALRMTGSLGIASYPDDAEDADGLMRGADVAMYQAKASHCGYDFYLSELDTHSPERLALAGELAAAIEGEGIEVHFQPKADARSRTIEGLEALVRWRRSGGELVPPVEFVAAAEHAGLSRPLTRRVIGLALDQLQAWRATGKPFHVAVNTTVADLLDVNFPDEVGAALAARDLPPSALILEVTESSVLSDPDRIGRVLTRLGELGVGLSLDDFGTGYSSLAHLKSLPVGEVKIDRSFVARMCRDDTDAAIVAATVGLAARLGIRIVAEGVEDEETWDVLAEMGADLIQGFLLSRPRPAAELEPLLTASSATPTLRVA